MSGSMRLLFAGGLLFAMTACKTVDTVGGFYGSSLEPGAKIEVRQELQVPPGLARIYLQYGQTMQYTAVDQYQPFCYFLMRQPLPVVQLIHPGVFLITAVLVDDVDVRLSLPVKVAGELSYASSTGRGPLAWQTFMELVAADQPEVKTLVCSGAYASPALAEPVRLDEIDRVFGDLATVRVQATRPAGQ